MLRVCLIPLVALTAVPIAAPAAATDFGVRIVGQKPMAIEPGLISDPVPAPARFPGIAAAARVSSGYGRVTSTLRSVEHNRAVGGVPNSYHLRGMAIDIARRPGVSHARIDAALRSAGYRLIESLDEGDHSHFAFAGGATLPATVLRANEVTRWGIVSAPRMIPVEPEPPAAPRLAADDHGKLQATLASAGTGAAQ